MFSASTHPSSPPVVMAHFGVPSSIDGCPCIMGHEYHLQQPATLEGIHVVPAGIVPPGLPIEGKTSPTMSIRPFTLHMFARSLVDSQVVSVFVLTIHGGVQWMPIPPPFNTMVVDMVAFDGDYEALSIIVNGFPTEAPAGGVVGEGDPTASALSDVSDEEEDEEDAPETAVEMEDSALHQTQVTLSATRNVLNSQVNTRLKKSTLKSDKKPEMLARIEAILPSTYYSNSAVSLQHVAMLVGEIFAFAESYGQDESGGGSSKTAQSIREQVSLLGKLGEYLVNCWSDRAPSSSDSVINSIGPEAANLLCSIVVNALEMCNFDTFLPSETAEERAAIFNLYAASTVRCCSALMGNAYMASEFNECNGMVALSALLRQQTHLEADTFLLVLDCVLAAVRHYELGAKFNEPVEDQQYLDEAGNPYLQQEVSPYQSLLYIAAGLTADAEASPRIGRIFRWCALVESLQALLNYSYTVFDEVAKASEALAARHAAVTSNTGGGVEEGDEGGGAGESDGMALLHPTYDLLLALSTSIGSKVRSLQAALTSCLPDLVSNEPLLHSCSKGKLMISVIAVASVSQISLDAARSADWKAPQYEKLSTAAHSNQRLLASLLQQLMSIPTLDTLFVFHSEEVQTLRKFLYSHSNLVACHNVQELRRFEASGYTGVDLGAVLASYGWAVWLHSYLFTQCLNVLDKTKGALDSGSALSSESLGTYAGLFKELTETCSTHAGRAVVLRVLAAHFGSTLVSLLDHLCAEWSGHQRPELLVPLFALLESMLSSRDADVLKPLTGLSSALMSAFCKLKLVVSSEPALEKKISQGRLAGVLSVLSDGTGDLVTALQSFGVRTIVEDAQLLQFNRAVQAGNATTNSVAVVEAGIPVLQRCRQFLLELKASLCKSEESLSDDASVEGSEGSILKDRPSAKRMIQLCSAVTNTLVVVVPVIDAAGRRLGLRSHVTLSNSLAVAATDLYCTLYETINWSSNEDVSESTRELSVALVSLLRHFCPTSADACLDSLLVPFLVDKAVRSLTDFEAVVSLMDALLPSRGEVDRTTFEDQDPSVRAPSKSARENWTGFLQRCAEFGPDFPPVVVRKHSKRKAAEALAADLPLSLREGKDPLRESLASKRRCLSTLLMAGVQSSSLGVQQATARLAHKITALTESGARCVAQAVLAVLDRLTNDVTVRWADNVLQRTTANYCLSRLLAWLDVVCLERFACVSLVRYGLLHGLYSLLHVSNGETVFLVLQVLTSVYRALSAVATVERDDATRYGALLVTESVGVTLARTLPTIVKKSTEFDNSLSVLQAVAISLQTTTPLFYKQFLDTLAVIGEGVTLEFVAVKLWIAFEDAFKLISETSDPRKSKHRSRDVESENKEPEKKPYEVHVQCVKAAWALQAIVDVAVEAFSKGWISLQVLSLAMRHQSDPKKITRRIQRAYTMWATGLLVTVDEDGAYYRSNHLTLESAACGGVVSENQSFESRHALVCYALKSLVSAVNAASKHIQARDRFPPARAWEPEGGRESADPKAPFSVAAARFSDIDTRLSKHQFSIVPFESRLEGLSSQDGLNALHSDFRGDMVKYCRSNVDGEFALKFTSSDAGMREVKRRLAAIKRKSEPRRPKKTPPPVAEPAANDQAAAMFLLGHAAPPPRPPPAPFGLPPAGLAPPPFGQPAGVPPFAPPPPGVGHFPPPPAFVPPPRPMAPPSRFEPQQPPPTFERPPSFQPPPNSQLPRFDSFPPPPAFGSLPPGPPGMTAAPEPTPAPAAPFNPFLFNPASRR